MRKQGYLQALGWACEPPTDPRKRLELTVVRLIADLQKMAVAEWLQSFNSVRGPMESLGII